MRQVELRPVAIRQVRVESETPSFAAITVMAPGVRFNAFAILATADLAFAIVFIVRTSSLVHARRTTFLALTILTPIHAEPGSITRSGRRP
jgi:hypothetical protein